MHERPTRLSKAFEPPWVPWRLHDRVRVFPVHKPNVEFEQARVDHLGNPVWEYGLLRPPQATSHYPRARGRPGARARPCSERSNPQGALRYQAQPNSGALRRTLLGAYRLGTVGVRSIMDGAGSRGQPTASERSPGALTGPASRSPLYQLQPNLRMCFALSRCPLATSTFSCSARQAATAAS